MSKTRSIQRRDVDDLARALGVELPAAVATQTLFWLCVDRAQARSGLGPSTTADSARACSKQRHISRRDIVELSRALGVPSTDDDPANALFWQCVAVASKPPQPALPGLVPP